MSFEHFPIVKPVIPEIRVFVISTYPRMVTGNDHVRLESLGSVEEQFALPMVPMAVVVEPKPYWAER